MYEMTFREKVHTILCIEGGMSKKAVEILDSTAGYKQKALYLLRQKGFIELKKGAYRLTKEGLSAEIWRDHVPKQYTSMAKASRDTFIRTTEGEMRRRMYQSEALAVMLEAGAELWEKDDEPATGEAVFIRASRMKNHYPGDKKAIKSCRAQGSVLGVKGRPLNVYVMGGGVLTWSHSSESRYKAWSEKRYLDIEGEPREAEAVLFIENVVNLGRFLGMPMCKGGPIRAGDVYKRMYVLPKNQMGTMILDVLLLENAKKLTDKIAEEEGGANFLLPDLVELIKLIRSGVKQICCLEGYGEGVKNVVPDVIIKEMPFENLVQKVLDANKR